MAGAITDDKQWSVASGDNGTATADGCVGGRIGQHEVDSRIRSTFCYNGFERFEVADVGLLGNRYAVQSLPRSTVASRSAGVAIGWATLSIVRTGRRRRCRRLFGEADRMRLTLTLGRLDGEGAFAVVETDDPNDILDATVKVPR